MELGRYRLLAELARGGMGIVHLAEARGPGGFEKLVVVKELKRELADDPVYCAMFLDEARLAARLSHRHIVETNEVGCENGRYFMALELLEGGSLHQIRSKAGAPTLPLTMGVRVLSAVLDALHHAHELTDVEGRSLGVVHRDVSPQNVFLTFDGDVKLIDFGVAKSKDRQGETKVGVVKGSVPYMSPDHVDGSTIDRRANVFAVGVLLREMLLGQRLWGDADDMTILPSLIRRSLPAFPNAPALPTALVEICRRAMAPKRADRYESAAAMRDELDAYLRDVDPRGSLADLGVWLGRALAAERAAFRALVRKSRTATAVTSVGTPAARSDVWLPSCDLRTRYSGPPLLPAAPPPLPAAALPTPSRMRSVLASAGFAVALAVAALSFAQPSGTGSSHMEPASAVARAPRTVEDAIDVSTSTSATHEAPLAADVEQALTTVAPDPVHDEPSAAALPASLRHETVPPNPYDPN